jgi:hypothetical protein
MSYRTAHPVATIRTAVTAFGDLSEEVLEDPGKALPIGSGESALELVGEVKLR